MISNLQMITIYVREMRRAVEFYTEKLGLVKLAEEIETTYRELKSRGVHFTLDLVRHDYGKGPGDQEARFVDPDGNEFLLHT